MSVMRSPTFLVGTDSQRQRLDEFQRRDQQFSEQYQKNKPLCFSSKGFQRTHPGKLSAGHKDADATLASPMMMGVADGVSQLEDYGMNAAELPNELLKSCEELSMYQLIPDQVVSPQDSYRGPISLLKEAYEATESLGSTTILLAILDNSTRIHGKLHPMVAVLTIGDCELLMLRRTGGRNSPLQAVFHTEMQRIDGHVQTPLQLARVDERVDPEFDEEIALEVIERGSAVHCISAYEGDIIVLGSDGVFDNLFLDEIVDLCNAAMPPAGGAFTPMAPSRLQKLSQRIVEESHRKSLGGGMMDTPIGRGGKMDDTSVVVGEVVEWTDAHSQLYAQARRQKQWQNVVTCGGVAPNPCRSCRAGEEEIDEHEISSSGHEVSPPYGRRGRGVQAAEADDDDDEDRCAIL